jgi:ADP-L-glycero-D-manno-heptose 6-epimerase
MIIVTGGAGFIGSRLVKKINETDENAKIVIVDDFGDNSEKYKNVLDLKFESIITKLNLLTLLSRPSFTTRITRIYHYGAESSTTCDDGKYLMENNYEYSKALLDIAWAKNIPIQLASSAAVYGDSEIFDDERDDYKPNNMYGFTKLLIDKHLRNLLEDAGRREPAMSLRLFNVISDGEFEAHKGDMQSPLSWMNTQAEKDGKIVLFEGSDEYKRDFIHIDNVVEHALELMPPIDDGWMVKGIFNIGTGSPTSFTEVAEAVLESKGIAPTIEYVPMPEDIANGYQKFTCADMGNYITRLDAGLPEKPFFAMHD